MKIAIVLNSPNKIEKVFEDCIIYVDGGYNNKKYRSPSPKKKLERVKEIQRKYENKQNHSSMKIPREILNVLHASSVA